MWVGLAPINSHCHSEVNLHTCNESVTTGSDSDLNETSLSRDVMAVDPAEWENNGHKCRTFTYATCVNFTNF